MKQNRTISCVHRRHGFSLIELLVVVAIVAVLAGMLLPAVALVKDAARGSTCASSLRQLQLANLGYAADYEQQSVPAYMNDAGGSHITPTGYWMGNPGFLAQLGADGASPVFPVKLFCPLSRPPASWGAFSQVALSYGLDVDACPASYSGANAVASVPLARLARGSEVIAFADGLDWQLDHTGVAVYDGSEGPSTIAYRKDVAYRHRGRCQAAMWDGHVETLSRADAAATARWIP